MQILLTKYWVLAHLLVTASTFLLVPGDWAKTGVVVWGAVSLLLFAFLLPPLYKGETFFLARTRTLFRFKTDVFLYLGALAIVFLLVQYLNGPRTRFFSEDTMKWTYTAPPVSWLPSSITPAKGLELLLSYVAGLVGLLALRNATTRKIKIYFLMGLAIIGAVLTVPTLVAKLVFEETFYLAGSTPLMAGFFHLMLFALGMGIVLEFGLEQRPKLVWLALIPLPLNLLGALLSGGLLLTTVALLSGFLGVVAFGVFGGSMSRFLRIYYVSYYILSMLIVVAIVATLLPQGQGVTGLFNLEAWGTFFDKQIAQWGFRSQLALDVWGDVKGFGAGPDGFECLSRAFVRGNKQWRMFNAMPTYCSCDFLASLCRNGVLGTLFLALPWLTLVGKCMVKWVKYCQDSSTHYSKRFIFVFWGSLWATVLLVGFSIMNTPFLDPTICFCGMMIVGCLQYWMPKSDKED